jgi:hypothetical protein
LQDKSGDPASQDAPGARRCPRGPRQVDVDGRWRAVRAEVIVGSKDWRRHHPKATLAAREAAGAERRARFRARRRHDVARASQAADLRQRVAQARPLGPTWGGSVAPRGPRERHRTPHQGHRLPLERRDAGCPTCPVGVCPPGGGGGRAAWPAHPPLTPARRAVGEVAALGARGGSVGVRHGGPGVGTAGSGAAAVAGQTAAVAPSAPTGPAAPAGPPGPCLRGAGVMVPRVHPAWAAVTRLAVGTGGARSGSRGRGWCRRGSGRLGRA